MSRLASLQSASTLSDLADLLGYKPKALSYILYKLSPKYSVFEIPKRSGGLRTIHAPVDRLKRLQRKVGDLLQDCVDEINSSRNLKDRAAHGFKRNRSIVTNARQHRHRRWVFNLDLEDFFPSINLGRVRGYFIKNRDYRLSEDVATVLAQIACHDGVLPQGSPCSPVISNIVAHLLDMRLVKLARSSGCTYSRYADDLTFSTNKKAFPLEIAERSGIEPHLWLPGSDLRGVIEGAGYRINPSKTHFMYRDSRQEVTGLVVNQRINVRREYRHNVRAMVRALVRTGEFQVFGSVRKQDEVLSERRPGTLDELHGMLGFIDAIDSFSGVVEAKATGSFSSHERVYREFLIYSNFYAATRPVLICEGDTDNVYLTHAIRSLASEFPDLAAVSADGSIQLKVRIYKYPKSSTSRLLDLRQGGSSALSAFLAAYKRETAGFTAPGLVNPVILIYDNDDGAKSIRNSIKQITRVPVLGTEPFVHVHKNLYAVPIPVVGNGSESQIEDLFDATLKATVVEGKSFNPSNNIDVDSQYGKKVFAHRVVRPRASTIDFSGFRPLLTSVVDAMKSHRSMVASI